MTSQEIDQKFRENQFHESAMTPETVQIKVEREDYKTGFYAYDKKIGLDYEWDGDGWKSCGSYVGTGDTILEAIDDFMEHIQEKRAAKADPNDKNFVYEIPFKWS